MHIHILGICGTFMGGIAQIAREAGHQVTGCDKNVYPPMSDALRANGITITEGTVPSSLLSLLILGDRQCRLPRQSAFGGHSQMRLAFLHTRARNAE